ncbi:MAG: DNA translocase FtsK 4TM domain-containing protein, partial [Armatimonadetes bacterium]|nr:DNA translocase FtsK 4TM domain-containing protein [Armatimonadota bacterium]
MAHTPGQSTRNRRLAAAVVLAVLAIFAGISLLPDATGFLPLLLGRLQRAAAGRAAPVLPALLVAAAALIARPVRLAERLGGAAALLVVAAVVLQTRVSQADVEAGLDPRPGGALGAAATWALSRLAGEIGLWVLLGLLGAAGVLLVLGPATAPTVRAFWQGLTLTGRGAAWVGRLAARAGAAVSRVARAAGAAAGVWAARWWVSAREWRDRRRAEALARAETARASTAADPAAAVQVIPAPVSADETRAGGPEAAAPSTLAGAGPAAQDAAPQPAPPTRPRRASRARETSESGAVASSTPAASATPAEERPIQYKLPPTDLLTDASAARGRARHDPEEVIRGLEKTLQSFGVEAKVVGYQQGPVVTRYEVQPAAGVKVQR